jgi:hypothetical protein
MADDNEKSDTAGLMAAAVIIELILKHGVPAAIAIITAWEVEEPTADDWEALKVKGPQEYFKDEPA